MSINKIIRIEEDNPRLLPHEKKERKDGQSFLGFLSPSVVLFPFNSTMMTIPPCSFLDMCLCGGRHHRPKDQLTCIVSAALSVSLFFGPLCTLSLICRPKLCINGTSTAVTGPYILLPILPLDGVSFLLSYSFLGGGAIISLWFGLESNERYVRSLDL